MRMRQAPASIFKGRRFLRLFVVVVACTIWWTASLRTERSNVFATIAERKLLEDSLPLKDGSNLLTTEATSQAQIVELSPPALKGVPSNGIELSTIGDNQPQFETQVSSTFSAGTRGGRVIRPMSDKLRVVCVVVWNEAPFLKEWIDFHLLAGFTRFVIYDHNSTDNIAQVLAENYPPDVVELIPVDWQHKLLSVHRSTDVQHGAYSRCFSKYWPQAQVIATFDVDEFVFPGRAHWNEPDPFEASLKAVNGLHPGSGSTTSLRLECFKYGFNNEMETPTENILLRYPKRAPYNYLERNAVRDAVDRANEFCSSVRNRCETYGNWKHVFVVNGQARMVRPKVHEYSGPAVREQSSPDRVHGLLCNHIRFRSYQHIAEKADKNNNPDYASLKGLPHDHPFHNFYSSFEDRSAIQFREHALRKLDNNLVYVS